MQLLAATNSTVEAVCFGCMHSLCKCPSWTYKTKYVCWLQVHNVQQSVIDTKNRAKDRIWRFWQTAFPKNQYDDLMSQGSIPSNTAAVEQKPSGHFGAAPAPTYSWRGRNWADQKGHLQRGSAGYDPAQAYHEARERGEDFLGKAEWKGRQGVDRAREGAQGLADSARDRSKEVINRGREAWDDVKEEGEELVESAKASGRRGWERTKEEWEHLKETVSPSAGMPCPALLCPAPPWPALPCPTWPCPALPTLPCPVQTLLCSALPCPSAGPCNPVWGAVSVCISCNQHCIGYAVPA